MLSLWTPSGGQDRPQGSAGRRADTLGGVSAHQEVLLGLGWGGTAWPPCHPVDECHRVTISCGHNDKFTSELTVITSYFCFSSMHVFQDEEDVVGSMNETVNCSLNCVSLELQIMALYHPRQPLAFTKFNHSKHFLLLVFLVCWYSDFMPLKFQKAIFILMILFHRSGCWWYKVIKQ